MMRRIDLCELTVNQYLEAIREEMVTSDSEFGCSIITPFTRPDGDFIEVLAERRDGQIVLSDMGETLAYLYLSGLSVGRALQNNARRIGNRYGITLDLNELNIEVQDEARLGEAMHNLVQTVLNVAALIEKRRPYVNLRFEEEVEGTIISQGRRYDPDFQVHGIKETHTVKFHVDSNLNLLIQPMSQATEIQARRLAERWNYYFNDILALNPSSQPLAVLDDRGERESIWDTHAITPLEGVATLIRWSERGKLIDLLSPLPPGKSNESR